MLEEAIDRILALAPVERFMIEGREYASKPATMIATPTLQAIKTSSLRSLVSLHDADFENLSTLSPVYHVVSHKEVRVFGRFSNDYATRTTVVIAELPDTQEFPFGTWLGQEEFIIKLNAHTTDYGDRNGILGVVSSLATEDKLTIEDDGIGQTATTKAGISRIAQVSITPRVALKPYRTFREVEQPQSEFLLRIRRDQTGMPKIALFEADGGRWKLEAMANIAEYLETKLPKDTAVVVS